MEEEETCDSCMVEESGERGEDGCEMVGEESGRLGGGEVACALVEEVGTCRAS